MHPTFQDSLRTSSNRTRTNDDEEDVDIADLLALMPMIEQQKDLLWRCISPPQHPEDPEDTEARTEDAKNVAASRPQYSMVKQDQRHYGTAHEHRSDIDHKIDMQDDVYRLEAKKTVKPGATMMVVVKAEPKYERPLIEVAPGFDLPLRGAIETEDAKNRR